MARGAWWATVHRVAKSQTQLRRLSTHACTVEVNTILNQLHFNKINLKKILLGDTEKAETLLLTGCHGSAEAGQVKECFLEEDIMCLKLY